MGYTEAKERLYGQVQRLRVDSQDLQGALTAIEKCAEGLSTDARNVAVTGAVADACERLDLKPIEENLAKLETYLEASSELEKTCADTVRKIENTMTQARRLWPARRTEPEKALGQARAASEALDELIYQAALLTLPERVDEHLADLGVGRSLTFHAEFRDELPKEDHRREILQYLADHPAAIKGVVDVKQGLIYRTSASRKYRVVTYLLPPLFGVLAGGVLLALAQLDNWGLVGDGDWPTGLDDGTALLSAYIFVLAGALLHLAIEAVKQARFGTGVPIYAVGDSLMWLHLRWAGLSRSLVPVLIVVVGLKLIEQSNWLVHFFAGYSVDSFAGLFLTRFDEASSTGVRALTARVTRRT